MDVYRNGVSYNIDSVANEYEILYNPQTIANEYWEIFTAMTNNQ